jgi:DNA-binding NtrC family response regulator
VGTVSDEALKRLCEYAWPGNVRELQATVERAAALAGEDGITLAHLPHEISQAYQVALAESGENFALKPARQAFEAQFIVRALQAANGNRTRAARLLGISHRNLLYKLKSYSISD